MEDGSEVVGFVVVAAVELVVGVIADEAAGLLVGDEDNAVPEQRLVAIASEHREYGETYHQRLLSPRVSVATRTPWRSGESVNRVASRGPARAKDRMRWV